MLELNRLSARYITTATEPGRHADGGGLYLSISENGGRRWVFLTRWRGKKIELGLGSARVVSLAQARAKAKAMREAIEDGKHPSEARKRGDPVPTFGEAADDLIAALEPTWRNPKHREQWRMTLSHYCKSIRAISVADLSTEDVLRVLKPIWLTKPETASRVRMRIERVIDAAKAKGHRRDDNPARWRGHLETLLGKRKKLSRGHHAAMPYADIPDFISKLRAMPVSVSNLALEFTILTAARSGETMGAKESEFDIDGKLWTVPLERMKAGREHKVPLTDRCLEILEAVKKERRDGDKFVFPGRRVGEPMSVMALAMALRRAGGSDYTVHGFRSSFRDWCGDETSFDRDVAEAALAHQIRDATEAAYRRATALEKRRGLMRAWTDFCEGTTGNVVQLHAAKTK
jgi:integrase